MSRIGKVSKLANAIRRYRGISQPVVEGKPTEWIISPKLSAEKDVERWLERLGFTPAEIIVKLEEIRSFTLYDQYVAWIQKMQQLGQPNQQ